MNLKIKFALPILALAGLLLQSGSALADESSIPLTGTAYGQQVGLLHFDYATAKRPSDDVKYNTASYYVGATRQFYIAPYVGNAKNPDFTGPGDDTVVARISTVASDCTVSGCLLKGFIWSDTVGWIVLDGKLINDAVNEATGFDPADDDKVDPLNPDPYPSLWYPRIKKSGAMTGIAWNKHAGWIVLASDFNFGTNRVASQQTAVDFGAWLASSAPALFVGEDQIGRPLHGYIWAENFGWIKLGIETEDSFAFDFQAYTNWVPDDTPPYLTASMKPWFAVGVNTGYDPTEGSPTFNSNPSTIVWRHFAVDPESGLNKLGSDFNLSPIPGETDDDCRDRTPADAAIVLTRSVDDNYSVDLTIPSIGNLQNTTIGYCKYRLTGKLLNGGSNLPTFIGDTFIRQEDRENGIVTADNTKDPILVYVRAGNPDIKASTVVPSGGGPTPAVVADGKRSFKYTVALRDVAGNPIRDIHCGAPYPDFVPRACVGAETPPCGTGNVQYQYTECPNREVTFWAGLKNELIYDLTQGTPAGLHATPVKYSESNAGTTGVFLDSDDLLPEVLWEPFSNAYVFEFVSYAPSESASIETPEVDVIKKFIVEQFEYKVENAALPALSKTLTLGSGDPPVATLTDDADTVAPAYEIDRTHTDLRNGVAGGQVTPMGFTDPQMAFLKPFMDLTGGQEVAGLITKSAPTGFAKVNYIDFTPPIQIGNPKLMSGTLQGTLTIGVPANLKFDISNYSSKAIAQGTGNARSDGAVSVDHILAFGSNTNSVSVALMETHRVADEPDSDQELGWSDPIQGSARYEMVGGGGCLEQPAQTCGDPLCYEPCDSGNSPFRGYYSQFNDGLDFCYDTISGSCEAPNAIKGDGTYDISGSYGIPQEYAPNEAGVWPSGRIDRNDEADFAGLIGTNDPDQPVFITKEIRFTPNKFVPVTISDIQMKMFGDVAYRYGDQPSFAIYREEVATNFNVLDIGLQAKGTVAGEQIVTGRQYDTVGTASTQNLQEQIRRNVSQMLSGANPPCSIPYSALTAFPATTDPCVIFDAVNDNAFAYYEGGPTETLVLGEGADLVVPDKPYTIVIKGGANLFIRSNIVYPDPASQPRSSLGFILIAAEIGKGANVFISPDPTNMVGTLYAEGSLLSRSSEGKVYYGAGGGDVTELKNQLYWQGSLASRNTIAGAGIEKVPEGISCINEAGTTTLECAQRYDLDYLRRFSAVVDATTQDSTISNNGMFSGGGTCEGGTCTKGALPSVVNLIGGGTVGKIDKAASELSTFYVEPSSRTATNPPPGFSTAGGQESTTTIR